MDFLAKLNKRESDPNYFAIETSIENQLNALKVKDKEDRKSHLSLENGISLSELIKNDNLFKLRYTLEKVFNSTNSKISALISYTRKIIVADEKKTTEKIVTKEKKVYQFAKFYRKLYDVQIDGSKLSLDEKAKKYFSNSYDIHRSLGNNECIVDFVMYYDRIGYELFIFEYFESTSLNDLNISNDQRLKLFFFIYSSMISTLHYLHIKNIVHCNIKPCNILISKDYKSCKLVNFNKALTIFADSEKILDDLNGTVNYLPPESYILSIYSKKNDVWSLGVSLYYLLLQELPFNYSFSSDLEQEKKILEALKPEVISKKIFLRYNQSKETKRAIGILLMLLTYQKKLRKTSEELLKENKMHSIL